MLIDSRWVDASGGATLPVHDPATGELLDTVPEAADQDIRLALEAAQAGAERMRTLPAHERAAILLRTAASMEAESEQLARLLAQENGKPIRQTREEVAAAVRIFRGFAEEARRLFGRSMSLDMVPGMERHFAFTLRQPVGVVAAIVPFNYPVELYAHKGAAALAAGNAVILKPPSDCPLALLRIAGYLEQAGLPRAAHQVVTGPGASVGEALASAPQVQLVSVTGSAAVGVRIATLAAGSLKKVHLELGGNDATIVCADADLDRAAEAVVLGRLARGNGQICCAVKRVLVASEVSERFTDLLAARSAALKVGSPLEEDTDVGPLINEQAAIRVEEDIREAAAQGAAVRAGGSRRGCFVAPTVLASVPAAARLLREESFGPVAPVVPFDTVEQAIALANDSPYGLQAAVFTNDLSTALEVAHRLEVGGVIVNWSSAVRVENLPFGGLKMSGHGRESIHDTLLEMTEQKTVLLYDALSVYRTP